MVGRKSRSRSCISCRKQQTKCDEQKSICAKCQQNGLSCDSCSEPRFYAGAKSMVIRNKFERSVRDKRTRQSEVRLAYQAMTTPLVDTCITHLNYYLSPNHTSRYGPAWVGFLAVRQPNGLAYQCLSAFAQAYFGRANSEGKVWDNGSSLYLKSLNRVRQQIIRTGKSQSMDLILSIMILTTYEMLVLSSQDAWINHALGLGTLVEMQGAKAFANESSRLLFEGCRANILLSYMIISKPTFLSKPDWKELPWSHNPDSKSEMQYLLDILAEVPTLRSKALTGSSPRSLRFDTLQVVNDLKRWRISWDAQPISRTIEVSEAAEGHSDHLFNSSLYYTSFYAANCVSVYDAILIATIDILNSASSQDKSSRYASSDLSTQSFGAAIEICQSVQYQMDESRDEMLGQLNILFPLRMAWKAFQGSSTPEGRWVEARIHEISSKKHKWELSKQIFTIKTASE